MKVKHEKVSRYVVVDATGKRLQTFPTMKAARQWIADYLAASERLRQLANK